MIVNAIIQARLGSTRYPGKMLERFNGQETVLEAVIEQVKNARGIDSVVVAIPNNEPGLVSVLMDVARGIEVHAGHPTDLTRRFETCLREYPCDAFIRICADSPLIDPSLISDVADRLRYGLTAYSNLGDNVPDGQHVEGVTTEFFKMLVDSTKPDEREHCLAAMYRKPWSDLPGIHIEDNPPHFKWPKMTVDYPEDLVLIRKAAALATRPISDIGWREWATLIRRADGDERRETEAT